MNETWKEDLIFRYRNQSDWPCYSKKLMEKMYPEGGYMVIGEVTKKKGKHEDMPIESEEGILYVQPLKTYKKLLYRRYAYIWNEEQEGYIVVKKSNWLLWLLSLLGSALLIGLIIWGFLNGGGINRIDPNAKDYESNLVRPADFDESKILIPGYNSWHMEAGSDHIYVALLNPKDNPCYFQFTVILDSTGETLFETMLIPPGQAVTDVTLPRSFEKGEYPITVRINSFDLEDEEMPLNGGEVKTKILSIEREK